MAGILVYSDKNSFAYELLTAAKDIAKELGLDVSALGINDEELVRDLSKRCKEVYAINNEVLQLADTAAMASALAQVVGTFDISVILTSSNRRGKELAGRLAAVLDCGCLTDVNGVDVRDEKIYCRRNAFGGATVATQVIETEKKVIAIAPKTFDLEKETESGVIREVEVDVAPSGITVIEVRPKATDAVDIEAAEVLVAMGQGLDSQEYMPMIEVLAKALGGEVACTKPIATDNRWLSEERIIGLSGKKCKPDLAILLGISGQVQFTVGIRDAKTIIAVNTDENANIMHMADYKMVADMKEVVSALVNKVG